MGSTNFDEIIADEEFIAHTYIRRAADGLRRGISRFAGQSMIAAIVGDVKTGNLYVYDEQHILDSHTDALAPYFAQWHAAIPTAPPELFKYEFLNRRERLFQLWFVKTSDLVVSPAIRIWLTAAANRIEVEILQRRGDAVNQQTRREMEHFARYAVELQLDELHEKHSRFLEEPLNLRAILRDLSRITGQTEEGKRANGMLAFIERTRSLDFEDLVVARFREEVHLRDYKHIVKTLQVVSRRGCLQCDNLGATAILTEAPPNSVIAEFKNGVAHVRYDGVEICRIRSGEFFFPYSMDSLDGVTSELRRQSCLVDEHLVDSIKRIVLSSSQSRHGASIAILPGIPNNFPLSGHMFEEAIEINDTNQTFLHAMSAVDGALVIDYTGKCHGFGFMFDGLIDPEVPEQRSRGARFNSALRFSRKLKEAVIITVSEDGPITLFRDGAPLYADPLAEPDTYKEPDAWEFPPTFSEWLVANPKPNQTIPW